MKPLRTIPKLFAPHCRNSSATFPPPGEVNPVLPVIFAALLFLAIQPNCIADLPPFKLQGQLTIDTYLNGQLQRQPYKHFTVVSDGCRWLIESSNQEEDFYNLKYSDGELLYNVARIPDKAFGRSESDRRPTNQYHVITEANPVPFEDHSGISLVWLAYCSSCYLNTVYDDRLRPVWMLDDPTLRDEGFTLRANVERYDLQLPHHITYINDGFFRTLEHNSRVTFRAPPPFDKGYTNAVYKALQTTNVSGIIIPTQFEFVRYAVSKLKDRFILGVRVRASGIVTQITSHVTSDDFSPQLEGLTFVQDARFAKANPGLPIMNYHTTNVAFLKSDDANVVKARRIAARNKAATESAKQPRAMQRLLLLVVAILFGGFAFKTFRKAE